ncbi:hypothetical protein ACBY01_09065 [Sphingomonas sp. ac-8]|uniref:hypothetical protein n=1 Tax=Sphingomonas sp. ac-8 TaxID=3242977 RepID=UPI003A804E12
MTARGAPALRWLGAVGVVGLYLRLLAIGDYAVTIGGMIAAAVLLLSLRRVAPSLLPLAVAALLLLWPLLVFAGASLIGAALLPAAETFLRSYALWAGSVTLITLAFVSRSPVQLHGAFAVALLVLGVAAAQLLLVGVADSRAGFALVAPLLGVDLDHGYLQVASGWSARAIGLYYEPSMCGRVLGTLAFVDLIRHRRPARVAAVLLLALLLTRSLGLVVLVVALGAVLLGRSLRDLLALALVCLAIVALQGDEIVARLGGGRLQQADSSAARRTVAPLVPLSQALAQNPAGIPVGANEHLAETSGYRRRTGETKITNGIYEAMLYLGVLGVAALGVALTAVAWLVGTGQRERGAALLYLLLSTALSGSFLAIESSLLTYFFVVACLAEHRRRYGHAPPPLRLVQPPPVRRPAWRTAG